MPLCKVGELDADVGHTSRPEDRDIITVKREAKQHRRHSVQAS